jgi:hypothetical protein
VKNLRAAIVAIALPLAAGTAAAAPPGFAFLEVPAGARAAALGGAYVTLSEGAEAAFWNPAGLAAVRGTQVAGSHMEAFEGLKHDQFALAGQLFGGGLAASLRAMYSQPIDERDALGNLVGTFGAHDLEFQLGYGRTLGGGAEVGVAAQAVRERISNESATTWSGSAGAAWTPQRWKQLRFGVAALHLGPAAHYVIDGQQGQPVGLPSAGQAGVSWAKPLSRGLALVSACDVRATLGRQAVASLGTELASETGAALRLGWREGDDLSNVSAGLGWSRGTFRVDYAWVPSRLDLADTHRFSFAAQF